MQSLVSTNTRSILTIIWTREIDGGLENGLGWGLDEIWSASMGGLGAVLGQN